MNQESHWPLGSRFMTTDEVSEELEKTTRANELYSMTTSTTPSSEAYARLTNELKATKNEQVQRESRPVNWLGRP